MKKRANASSTPSPSTATPTTSTTILCKTVGYDWFKSIGSPRFVLSPMVGQSELAYRLLCRKHGAVLTYTPMIIASQFIIDAKYRKAVWQYSPLDRPLVVQLCANVSEHFIQAAEMLKDYCDAIELNLGCPQDVAKRGGYGSWMMEKQPLIQSILTTAVAKIDKPITAKIRVFESFHETLSYIQMLQACGISLLTIHPRQRHHREEVLADWDAVRLLRQHLSIPVVLNGDMWGPTDVAMAMCLIPTDGFMCAQGALQMPSIFETVSEYASYNRPNPQVNPSNDPNNIASIKKARIVPDTTQSKGQNDEKRVSIFDPSQQDIKNVNIPEKDTLTFISTLNEPFNSPQTINYFRQRKFLGTGFGINAKNTKNTNNPSDTTGEKPATPQILSPESIDSVNNRIKLEYDALSLAEKAKYTAIIQSYPLTPQQRLIFNANPLNTPFLSLVLHHESCIDTTKRQLQNAVEYLRIIEHTAPVHHHSIAARHFFFILFDLLQKHLDCYDKLWVAKNPQQFKEVIVSLHKKAVVNADFQGCAKDNYFAVNHKERSRRRDGTLAPPPWPAGGGGFNVANNAQKKEVSGAEKKNNILKSIDMSKFD